MTKTETLMIRKYRRTGIYVIDEGLLAWAKYKAELMGLDSFSEYLFKLVEMDKEKNLLHID